VFSVPFPMHEVALANGISCVTINCVFLPLDSKTSCVYPPKAKQQISVSKLWFSLALNGSIGDNKSSNGSRFTDFNGLTKPTAANQVSPRNIKINSSNQGSKA
jgi:hypothetical protein